MFFSYPEDQPSSFFDPPQPPQPVPPPPQPQMTKMVSRRKILSRSRDDLNMDNSYFKEEEDIWYQKDKLYKVRLELQPGVAI